MIEASLLTDSQEGSKYGDFDDHWSGSFWPRGHRKCLEALLKHFSWQIYATRDLMAGKDESARKSAIRRAHEVPPLPNINALNGMGALTVSATVPPPVDSRNATPAEPKRFRPLSPPGLTQCHPCRAKVTRTVWERLRFRPPSPPWGHEVPPLPSLSGPNGTGTVTVSATVCPPLGSRRMGTLQVLATVPPHLGSRNAIPDERE